MVRFAKSEAQINLILGWLESAKIVHEGKEIMVLTLKQKLNILKRVFSSTFVAQDKKDELLEALRKEDSSDLFENSEYYCKAAIPTVENKQKMWNTYMDDKTDWKLNNFKFSFAGFNQTDHMELVAEFEDSFFANI